MTNLLVAFCHKLMIKVCLEINNLGDSLLDELQLMTILVLRSFFGLVFTNLHASHQLVYLNSQHRLI
jgi:hypothetical protein